MTQNEARERGYAALLKELGPVGYVRFIQQFQAGKGDYSKERHALLDQLGAAELRRMLADDLKQASV
jgi:hypothetical protein